MSFEIGGVVWTPIEDESIKIRPIMSGLGEAALVDKVLKELGLSEHLRFGHCSKWNDGFDIALGAVSLDAVTFGNVNNDALYEASGFLVETLVVEDAQVFISSVFGK